MKLALAVKKLVVVLCITFVISGIAGRAFALDIPSRPKGYVHDEAELLSPTTRAQLNQYLMNYERQTSNQVVLATFVSLEGEALEDYSIRLSEAWKVGQKGKDNGIIFIVFRDDKRMRIEVGYGLEGVLPDALSGRIIQQVVAPYFQGGQFEQGILAGLQGIIEATRGEYTATRQNTYRQSSSRRQLTPAEIEAMRRQSQVLGIVLIVLVAILFALDLHRYRKYKHANAKYIKCYSFGEWWFRFAILFFIINIIFRMMFYAMLFSRGGYYGSRGGFRGMGGGFSGGGGGFGGGGASGGW